jgi:nucleoside phosphorylase
MAAAQTFAELWSRVPRGKRTDRMAVLIALFVRGAIVLGRAIQSTDLRAELRIRLGAKQPKNIPDVLRKSAPDVECSEGNDKVLRWHLTATGLARLCAELQLPLPQEDSPSNDSRYDVALVCALHRPELTALLHSYGGETRWAPGPSSGQTHIYKVTEFAAYGERAVRVIAGAPTYMGLTATAILATQMILLFRPRLIATVGIAAGTRRSGRGLGDILVADPSVDYASGKVTFVDGAEAFQPDPFPLPINPRLRTLVQEDARTRVGLDAISAAWEGERPVGQLNVHIGALGAADQVVDSARRVAEVQRNWRKLIGVEMETYALYRAAHEAPSPRPLYLSFKSVCDFAAEKGDAWQNYAAYTAAEYSRRFLFRHWNEIASM